MKNNDNLPRYATSRKASEAQKAIARAMELESNPAAASPRAASSLPAMAAIPAAMVAVRAAATIPVVMVAAIRRAMERTAARAIPMEINPAAAKVRLR